MLVLSRQRDESIIIGDEIELTVVDIRGDKVRIGINAPPQVPVHRKEVYEAIRRENEQAARMSDGEFDRLKPRVAQLRERRPSVDIESAVRLNGSVNRQDKESA